MSGPATAMRLAGVWWPLVAVVAATVPLAGAFSATHVFYVRDLGMYFWPSHVWLRHSWAGGESLLWDPYTAAGQSAVANALNQYFFLPVTLLRLALPDVAGFNLWVAAPFPVGALGAWLWLRRQVSAPAACVGAAFFAAAGPVASTSNFPNLSWSVALIPWALWTADRLIAAPGARRTTALALCMALQAVAGEPLTLAATSVLLIAYAWADRGANGRRRLAGVSRIGIALCAGALLSGVQTLPSLWAASRSARLAGTDPQLWSLHPMSLADTVVAHLFGHYYDAPMASLPWLLGLNQRDPFFVSLYIGLGALVLATLVRADTPPRHTRRFWWLVAGVALVCALGEHTPVYGVLQAAVPPLQVLRFPAKYLVVSVVALAALAAAGADALLAHARTSGSMKRPLVAIVLAGGTGAMAAAATLASVLWPGSMLLLWEAAAAGVPGMNPAAAAQWILGPSIPRLAALSVLGVATAGVVAVVWHRHRFGPVLAVAICVFAVADPFLVNRDLHPTMPASRLGPPAWMTATRSHAGDRVYVGGRVRLESAGTTPGRLDVPREFDMPADMPPLEAQAAMSAQFAYSPSAWRLREMVSYDLPQLWPREYWTMLEVFQRASRDDRLRFLQRTGVRYCYVAEPPSPGAPVVFPAVTLTGPMALYDCSAAPRRVYITPDALVEPDPRAQLARMFDARHDPARSVLLEREVPRAAGYAGPARVVADARVLRDGHAELIVAALVGDGGGYLNVLDSYDPDWLVTVDGEPAVLLRANALFRAVRLAPGLHEVRFTYRPTAFYAGLAISVAAALLLLLACGGEWLTARKAALRMRQAVTAS